MCRYSIRQVVNEMIIPQVFAYLCRCFSTMRMRMQGNGQSILNLNIAVSHHDPPKTDL